MPACLLFFFPSLPHPFNIYFSFCPNKKKKKGNKNKTAPVKGYGRWERGEGGSRAQSPPRFSFLPCGGRRGGAGWAGGNRTHAPRPGHARPPPRARAVPPSRGHPGGPVAEKGMGRGGGGAINKKRELERAMGRPPPPLLVPGSPLSRGGAHAFYKEEPGGKGGGGEGWGGAGSRLSRR